jgi:hypothetical protein
MTITREAFYRIGKFSEAIEVTFVKGMKKFVNKILLRISGKQYRPPTTGSE